ncbi:MAG TPA: hypothetical protein VFG20_04550 [Planctomycetaceae bacterium]|nr:hypothetical protein [Planctomycetaceae bacterium]
MVRRSFPAASAAPAPLPSVSTRTSDEQTTRILLDKFHNHPGLAVGSLVIHQCAAGLCIEGHVHLIDPTVNLAALLAEFDTPKPILNRVMVTHAVEHASTSPV